MDKQLRNLILIIAGALLVTGIGFYVLSLGSNSTPPINGNRAEGTLSLATLADKSGCQLPASGSNLDDFAKCISSKGIKFYGAHWCPHCKDQKALFGDSAQYLPYIECSTPDSTPENNTQLQVCIDAGIQSYPTWDFSNIKK